MEVHYHPKKHEKERKSFSAYVTEFFLLFLAVFMGFIAENVRERLAENKRGKEYMKSLLEDMQADTLKIKGAIHQNAKAYDDYDSLLQQLKTFSSSTNSNLVYYYFIPTTYYHPFHASERTIQQLESSGQLRLFRDLSVSDSITSYYEMVKAVEGQYTTLLHYFDVYHEQAFKIFSYAQIDTSFFHRRTLLTRKDPMKFITTDPKEFDVLFSKLYVIRVITKLYIDDLEELEDKATSIINLIKTRYRL